MMTHLTSRYQSFSANGLLPAILLCAVVFVPLWSVAIPPLVDYPNHLAREYILAHLAQSENLRLFYQANWSATPYLAMDALVQVLAHVMPVALAAKLFLALTLLLLAMAPIALSHALHGRVAPIALVGLLFVHNTTVSLGFVNYLFSLGFALCLLSGWILAREGRVWIRLIMLPVLSTLLFFSHLIGFVVYALTVCAYEFGRHLEEVRGRTPHAPLALNAAQRQNLVSFGVQFLLPLTIFWLFGPSSETSEMVRQTTHGGIGRKFDILFGMFDYLIPPYIWSLDRILVIALPLALLLLLALRTLELSKRMLWPLLAMLLLFFVMPMQWLGGWGGDHRLLPAIGLMFAGSLRLKKQDGKTGALVLGLLAVLIALRTAAITVEWRKADAEYAQLLRAFESLTAGSRVYYAFGHAGGRDSWLRPKYFVPCLAVMSRQVYVPYLFTSNNIPGIPLQYKPEYYELQRLSPGPILVNGQSPDWGAITGKYDYFILGDAQFFATPVPQGLVPIYQGSHFTVYKNPTRAINSQ
jgi:hypothetical protein